MSSSKLQAWAEDEANRLIKKYDKNGDGVLNKEELKFFLQTTRGSTQVLSNQGFISKIPKAYTNFGHKHGCNYHKKSKRQSEDIAKKSSTNVLDGETPSSNMQLSREQIKEIFKYHDTDKDGFLNIRELTKAFAFMGSILPYSKAHYALAYDDANKDDLISEAELHKLIDYSTKIINKK